MATQKELRRTRIKMGIRKRITGTMQKPRLTVFRSNTAIYAQLIDDVTGTTLASASSHDIKATNLNLATATSVGKTLAEKAKAAGLETVVFDRNGYLYHGRIKALAEGAREGGLKF
jgi:large subunit ribosomal protein L18